MKLVYDVASMPVGLSVANLTKIFEQHHVVFWDSAREGTKPKLFAKDDTELVLALVDTEGKEVDFEKYQAMYEDGEFWNKELHNCKASPIYFFNNYGTTKWPATSEDIQKYMLSIGLINIEAEDSTKAEELWEKQKAVMKKAAEAYTIPFLKERQAAVEVLKAEYLEKITQLEDDVKDNVELYTNKGEALSSTKRISNLIEKIRRITPIPAKYSAIYRNSRGKWDVKVLYNTPYGVVLEMYSDLLSIYGKGAQVLGTKSK